MISYDKSWNSILVKCSDCEFWFALRLDQATAYKAGEDHAINVHNVEPARAAEPRRLWEKRHAGAA